MAHDPKTLIRRVFEDVVNQGRDDVIDELFHPDFTDHGPGVDLHGRDQFRAVMGAWRSAFSNLHAEVSHLIVEGDTVAWVVRTTGTHTGDSLGFPATGKSIDTLSANVGTIRDGKCLEHWSEQGQLAMMQQLGLIPAMGAPQPVS